MKKIITVFMCTLLLVGCYSSFTVYANDNNNGNNAIQVFSDEITHKKGLKNINGEIIVEAKYDSIYYDDTFDVFSTYDYDYYEYETANGLIDGNGKEIFPPTYKGVFLYGILADGRKLVVVTNENYQDALFTTTGEQVLPFKDWNITGYTLPNDIIDIDLIPVYEHDTNTDIYTLKYIDLQQNTAFTLPTEYSWAMPFSEGKAAIVRGEYVDFVSQDETVIRTEYSVFPTQGGYKSHV